MNEVTFTREQAKRIVECIYGTHFSFLADDGKCHIDRLAEAGYIVDKKEELLIVHNIMKYRGEYYLKQPLSADNEYVRDSPCSCCYNHIHGEEICGDLGCRGSDFRWVPFINIEITDDLACMRKDIGVIYITHRSSKKVIPFTHLTSGKVKSFHNGMIEFDGGLLHPMAFDLSTAEEIQKYLGEPVCPAEKE